MLNPTADRLATLRQMSAEDLAWLLTRVPIVADALPRDHPPGLHRLAELLVSRGGIRAALTSLNEVELRLVTLARWYGGKLTRGQARREAGGRHDRALDSAAEKLGRLLLADPDQGWVVLRPGVAEGIGLPGVPIRDSVTHLPPGHIAELLAPFGPRQVPRGKRERIDLLERTLRDPKVTTRILKRLPAEAQRLFGLLCAGGAQRVRDLGIERFDRWYVGDTPLDALVEAGLAGADYEDQVCWVWLDVIVGLNGCLYRDWQFSRPWLETRPLHDSGGVPASVSTLDTLLETWAAQPAPALAGGGLGVRPVRSAARQLGLAPGEVGLLAHLAVTMGLLGRVSLGAKGQGRNRTAELAWAPTGRLEEWRELPASTRWALLVQAWRHDTDPVEDDGLPERVELGDRPAHLSELNRAALLALLEGLPGGEGLPTEDLRLLADFEQPALLGGPLLDGFLAAARALGLVPRDGPVGLTRVARALLAGAEALESALPPPREEFIVQADQTIIAPPNLAPGVAARLERYADLESAAGARTYRLSQRRLTVAFDEGDTVDDVLGFLRAHSTVDLAQNVTYLVSDLARRHGRVRAGACSSYVRCDDAGLLSSAATVKGANLRVLAPSVAVSTLPRDKLVAALRERGVMAVAEGADGVTIRPVRHAATLATDALPHALTLRERLDDSDIADLAKLLVDTEESPR